MTEELQGNTETEQGPSDNGGHIKRRGIQDFLEKPSPVIRALLGTVLVGAILVLISWAAPIITPIMVAGFVAALVAPHFFWLQGRGVSTGVALILLVALVVVVILFMAGLLWISAERTLQ